VWVYPYLYLDMSVLHTYLYLSNVAAAQHLRQPEALTIAQEIDEYVDYMFQFFAQLIEKTVPWAKPGEELACA
jgi:hypothetical protein